MERDVETTTRGGSQARPRERQHAGDAIAIDPIRVSTATDLGIRPPRSEQMATPERTGSGLGGIGLGGILVIAGILLAIFWSLWVGLIIVLVGLIAFGGFARGRWY